jgi:hypothetical protein
MLGLGLGLQKSTKLGGFIGLLDLFPGAAAAYSLRKLRAAYSGSAVRVRRSSDNTEQDIGFTTQGELDTASLLSFVNEDVVTFNQGSVSPIGGTVLTGQSIADRSNLIKFTYTGGATNHQVFAAGNHPDTNNTYTVSFSVYFETGQACNGFAYLKPDGTSDAQANLTQGIWHSFTYTNVNGGSNLSRFIPSVNGSGNTNDDGANFYIDSWIITQTTADGLVSTWYDQSLSNDATQGTGAAQPKIVSGGSLVTENGKPAVDFDGVDDYLSATTVAYSQPNTIFSLVNARSIGGNDYIYDSANTSNRNALASFMFAGSVLSVGGYTINTQQLRSNLFDSTNSINWVNGTQTTTGNAGSQSMQGITLAANRIGTDNAPIKHQEFILYNSDQSSNRTGIETNINTFYSIYP